MLLQGLLVEIVFLLANSVRIVTSGSKSILLKAASPAPTNNKIIKCMLARTDKQYMAVMIANSTGTCEGLPWGWGCNRIYDAGYTYFEKMTLSEVDEQPVCYLL